MRALHVIPALAARYGGPSLAAVGMGHALREAGIEVLFAATNADGPNVLPVELGEETDFQGVPAIFFERHLTESFKFSPELAAWVRGQAPRYDVVHIHGVFSHPCVAAAAACREHGVPYVVRPLGNLSSTCLARKPIRKRIAWRAGIRTMLEGASAVHYTSEKEKEDVEDSLGLRRGVVIPHGVALNDRRANPPEAPYVLALSRIHPVKRLELLIDSFIQVTRSDELKDWRLVVAGDGEPRYVNRLIDMVFKARVSDRILFTGWLDGDEKAHVLRDASLFALTSAHENFGMSVAEAMASGLPVVVSEHVDLSVDVRRSDAGWITSLNPADVQHKLRDALLHETVRHKRGANARRLVEEKFTWPRVAEQLTDLYGRLTARETGRMSRAA